LRLFLQKNGMDRYKKYLGLRYPTFRYAFDEFVRIGGKTIVELGTSRSFVAAGHAGCGVNDPRYWRPDEPRYWDWGAGIFTRMCALHLRDYRPQIHSVDISKEAIDISKVITAEFANLITYHLESSESFLTRFPDKIDLLYMDAGETGDGADQLHLREATIVCGRGLLSQAAVVLIDDVNIPGTSLSKGTFSIPFFLASGFEVRIAGYQAVLQRSDASPV